MEKKNLLEDKFMTSAKFSQEVEKIAVTNSDMNYIDSVLHLCDLNQIEVESVSKLISKPLKGKLKCNATELNYLKKTSLARFAI